MSKQNYYKNELCKYTCSRIKDRQRLLQEILPTTIVVRFIFLESLLILYFCRVSII